MFQRYVSIDWSGAATDSDRVDLRVAEGSSPQHRLLVPPPSARAGIQSWSRDDAIRFLSEVLHPHSPRALVAMDFGFGLPWGADRVIFGCTGWQPMLQTIARLYQQHETARATGETINANPQFNGHGPYRFNESRADFRFYVDNGMAYYRLVELAIPQAISQWYLGSGGTVGFHTISGLAALAGLLDRRDARELSFSVWPQEIDEPSPDQHLVVESYPAICPRLADFGPCRDDHQRDAWRVLDWLLQAATAGTLARAFAIPEKPFGRIEGVSFRDQVRFEGWMIGVT